MNHSSDYPITVHRDGRDISVSLDVQIDAERRKVFDYVAAEGVLTEVLTGYALLPAVISTSSRTGPWNVPGSSRIVYLKNGSTAREEVTGYERPAYFSYEMNHFTFALRFLATAAKGQWWFVADGSATRIRWRYALRARGWLGSTLLPIFARLLWAGYMSAYLRNLQRQLADRAPQSAPYQTV
jgi:hypothetical protein